MRRALSFAILLPVTVLLLLGIVWVVGPEDTLRAVERAGVCAFAIVAAVTLLTLVAQTVAWDLLGHPIGHRVPLLTLFGGITVGQAGNMITPSTYLGGEPLRIAYVGKMASLPYHEVAGTVLLSKYLEFLSFMVVFAFSAAVAGLEPEFALFSPPNRVGGIAIVAVAALLLAFSAVLWVSLVRRRRPLTRVVRALAWFRPLRRPMARLWRRAAEMEDQVSRTFCEERGASLAAFGVLLVSHAAVFVKPLAFFLLSGFNGLAPLSLGKLCLIFVAGQLLLSVQLTPSGVGMLDGGLIGTFALLGYDSAVCMAYLLCLRLWDAVVIGAGACLAARAGARFFAAKPPSLLGSASDEKGETAP